MKNKKLWAALVMLVIVAVVGTVIVTRGQSAPSKIVYLNAEQEAAIKKVDVMMSALQEQYKSLQQQRGALITGFAISTTETKMNGLEWASNYDFIEDKTGHGFRALIDAEKKERAEAATKAASQTQPGQ